MSVEIQLDAMAGLASLLVGEFRCWVLDACTTAEPVKSERNWLCCSTGIEQLAP